MIPFSKVSKSTMPNLIGIRFNEASVEDRGVQADVHT